MAVKVKALMNLLSLQQMPRRLYGAACTHVFGDAMCGYDRFAGKNALGTSTGNGHTTVTAAAGTIQGLIACTAAVPTVYSEGTITGATGATAGYSRTIANLGNGSQIGLLKAFLRTIPIRDTLTLLPGSDPTTGTCHPAFHDRRALRRVR